MGISFSPAQGFVMEHALFQLKQIAKSFPDGTGPRRVLFSNLNWSCHPGETHFLTGPSGSGKTTLLHLMARLIQPDSGNILWEGREIQNQSQVEDAHFRRQAVGMVFQEHLLLPHLSALENIMLPCLGLGPSTIGKALDFARASLRLLGMGGRENQSPETLSGGERQRVAVIRAMVLTPKMVLADEPTGALDRAHAALALEALHQLCLSHGAALVVVTHGPRPPWPGIHSWKLEGGQLHQQA